MRRLLYIVGILVLLLGVVNVVKGKPEVEKQDSPLNLRENQTTLTQETTLSKETALSKEVTATKEAKAAQEVTATQETKAKQEVAATQEASIRVENKKVVVIDPGHQSKGDYGEEAVGPGAKEKKPKTSSGTQGRFTGVAEYEVNLQVATKLEKVLKAKGYEVIMTRTTNDVNISNQERAEIANDCDADVFVRIHCNGSEDASVHGILTICPTKNSPYCKDIYEKSRKLSDSVLNALVTSTGANNAGVTETDSMSGINWSLVPVTIVEMGYMTNKEEDTKLVSENYQEKLVNGLAEGIENYLNLEE